MDNIIDPQRKAENTYGKISTSLPFNLTHPEMDLIPYSEIIKVYYKGWSTGDLDFGFGGFLHPDYVERPSCNGTSYLFIVRNSKIGIAKWWYKENIFGAKKAKSQIIIPCKYDRIDKRSDMFVCYKNRETVFMDLQGQRMR